MLTNSTIRNKLFLIDAELTSEHLRIVYTLNGNEMSIICSTPEEICCLLKKHGYIEDYSTRDGLMVVVERNVNGRDVPVNTQWSDFIMDYSLTQGDFFTLACEIEKDKLASGVMKFFLDMPDMVARHI
jgi:hypothetical protein